MSRAQVVGAVAMAVVLVGAVATILIVRSGSSDGHRRVAPAPTTTSTSSGTAPSTSAPAVSASTTTATTSPAPSNRRLYPAYLPSGVGPGALWIYADPKMDSGYTQSYYGAPNAAGKPVELVIGERPARVGEGPTAPAKFAGRDVLMWHSHDSNNPVIVLTAKLSRHDVTLVSYALSDRDLGAVLNGLQPRSNGRGWETRVLPTGLRLFGEGDQTPEPSDVYYILEFGPFNQPGVSVSVHPGALLPEDTCICNPGMRRSLKTTTVNGTPAVVIDRSDTDVRGQAFEVDWQFAPDVVAGVSVYRYDENEAMRIASTLTAADPTTWAALRCVNAAGVTVGCSPEQEVPTSG